MPYNLTQLSNEQLLYNIIRQKVWQESYRKTDPYGTSIKTTQDIINELYKEILTRGIKCLN